MPLDDNSRELVTINTHKGIFQYTRLPFSVSVAPAVFQRCMKNLFQGCKGVSVYLDDLLVTGSTVKEHLENLDKSSWHMGYSWFNTESDKMQIFAA